MTADALIFVNGWVTYQSGRYAIQDIPVHADPRLVEWERKRVSAVLRMRNVQTQERGLPGRLMSTHLLRVRKARHPNGASFTVSGKLQRFDSAEGVLSVRLSYELGRYTGPRLTLRCTQRTFREIDPSQYFVRVSGSVLSGVLIADKIEGIDGKMTQR